MRLQIKTLSFRIILFLITCFSLLSPLVSLAQQKVNTDSIRVARQNAIDAAREEQRRILDSTRTARQHLLDSTRAAQKRVLDSARTARQHTADSLKAVRMHIADSLATIRKYRSSKHYKDSVAQVRKHRVDSMKMARQHVFDSIRTERQRVADSLLAIRKHTTDSIRAVQKHRADSLAVIRKYRGSKRYKDSVALVRQIRVDSTREARKHIADSMIAVRKHALDSAAAVRKHFNDSVTAVRTKYMDSVKAVRKARADSLAKVKAQKEGLQKTKEKQKEDKMKLALELKIKQKRSAWNNEKMLKKKWSVPRRLLQNTYTHYNYYFNADKKMDEALANMQRMSKEDYDSLLALFPFDPDRDSTKLAPDMDSIIRKASVGIQIHDPRTKWADDLYLLMGQAYYYKGNYAEAATSFRYIIAMNQRRKAEEMKKAAARKKPVDKEVSVLQQDKKGALDFLKHKPANNEAILWLARTYTEGHREDDAESILDLIETDKNLTDDMKGRIALEKAYLNLSRKKYVAASENLALVIADEQMPDWIRMRAAFLNGQLAYEQKDYLVAAQDFQTVIDLNPKIDMDFYARKNLAYSLLAQGGSQEQATASLRRMLNDGKYIPYYEQVYYVLGRLSLNSKREDDALNYFQQSIASTRSTRKQKALSFSGLGDVHYLQGRFRAAKLAYDSAAVYGKSISGDDAILLASKRSKVLDRVVAPIEVIAAQDSLLRLASLSEKEQRNIVRKYIRLLEKQREDSIARAADGANASATPEESDPGAASGGTVSWYFSNPVELQQGFNDFKRKWGNRTNTDNWRRTGNGGTVAAATGENGAAEGGDAAASPETDENGLPTEASLLAAIPGTAEEQELAKKRIQDAYIALADAYVKELEDYPHGSTALDTLDTRFPAHSHKAEATYLRYLIALRQNKLSEAQAFSEQLRNNYGESQWAKEVAPSQNANGLLASNVSVANYYDETYGLMMQRRYSDVLQRVRTGQQQFTDPVYNNRFRIMEAIALAGVGSYGRADSLLTEFIAVKPSDSLRSWADAVLDFIRKNKPAADTTDSTSTTAMAPADTTATPPAPPALPNPSATRPGAPAAYAYKPSSEHFFVFYFNKVESKTLGLKAGLSDFNTFNFSAQNLSVGLEMLKPNQGMILVKSFPSAAHAKVYLNAVRSNNLLLKEYKPEEYTLMLISADNYKKLSFDRDMDPYLKFYKASYK